MRRLLLIFALMFPALFCSGAGSDAPRKGHPRLYVNTQDISVLKARVATPEGAAVISRLEALSQPRTAGEQIPAAERDFRYYFQMRGLASKAQLLALDYLMNGNTHAADSAVTMVLDSLRRTSFPKSKDLSRASGVMLMVGAMVYDWCYDRLDEAQKTEYIDNFKRIASTMECGYPINHVEDIAGHTGEWMIMRDMFSAAVAIYDEYPQMYEDVLQTIREHFIPSRNYCYAAGNYHQGSKYLPTRYSAEMFAQWIYKKAVGGGSNLFDPAQQSLLYDVIYRMRPDGTVLACGDENPTRKARVENFALPALLASSYYNDPHLAWLYAREGEVIAHSAIFELLWAPEVKPAGPEDLSLTRYCPAPFGWMTARTGWGEDAVICEMKINEQFAGNHQHLDGGAFQIWYKGSLAIDSGVYEGVTGGYNSEHCRNYSKRTIAHNSLLVCDPAEQFAYYKPTPRHRRPRYAANDGGQRMPGPDGWDTAASLEAMMSPEYTVGKVLYHSVDDNFSCLSGDITAAYSAHKVDLVQRSFAFCNMHGGKTPAVLVVCDRIISKDPSMRKVFLLHSITEPVVKGRDIIITSPEGGKLHCTVLSDACIKVVGGPGREFEVDGKNYPNSVEGDDTLESGAWRVEVSPSKPALESTLLTALRICDADAAPLKIRKIHKDGCTGISFAGRSVIFAGDGTIKTNY